MLIGRVAGATHVLGAPRNWDEDRAGKCNPLVVRKDMSEAGPVMTSAWFPTADELDRLIAGAPIHLTIFGEAHPPVALSIGDPPVDPSQMPLPIPHRNSA
jgi:hypothetical protein